MKNKHASTSDAPATAAIPLFLCVMLTSGVLAAEPPSQGESWFSGVRVPAQWSWFSGVRVPAQWSWFSGWCC